MASSFVRVADLAKKESFIDRLKAKVFKKPAEDPLEEVYLLDFHGYSNANGTNGFTQVGRGGLQVTNSQHIITTGTMYNTSIVVTGDNEAVGEEDSTGFVTRAAAGMFVRSTDLPLPEQPAVTKIPVKPVQVLAELEIVPDAFSMAGLDAKIDMFEAKRNLLHDKSGKHGPGLYAKRDIEAVLERLRARKNYEAHKDFFSLFRNTTDEKINPFVEKHEFAVKPSDLFLPDFPADAIAIMGEYKKHTQAVTGGKSPIFYVIANAKDFKDAYGRRDPILLAQAPFGFYWQILGAWDEEMLVLHEL